MALMTPGDTSLGILAMDDNQSVINPVVESLLSRSHGGSGAVVVPGISTGGKLPGAPAPAGVHEAIERLFSQVTRQDPVEIVDWVFLVGGPGNGKSHQLDLLLSRLKRAGVTLTSNNSGTAGRYFPLIENAGKRLRIVNDATIRPPSSKPATVGHLAGDLREGIASTPYDFLLVNANRGVLIEESFEVKGKANWEPFSEVLAWLVSANGARSGTFVEPGRLGGSYYSTAIFRPTIDGPRVRLHAISLDMLSLLERIPSEAGVAVKQLGEDTATCANYRVMQLNSEDRWEAPIGKLLEQIVSPANFEDGPACGQCPSAHLCPILANAKSLRRETGGKGLLSTLRSSEIISGRLFTYRDAWSLLATAIAGPARPDLTKGPACMWVHKMVARTASSDAQERKRGIVELELQRCHQALFPNRLPSPLFCGLQAWRLESPARVPAASNLLLADPARDVAEDWAANVSRSMEEWAFQESPLAKLRSRDSGVERFTCELDVQFEKLLLEYISGEKIKDSQRRDHLRWLGTAYYRLYSLVASRPGQASLVDQWITVRTAVDKGQAHVLNCDLHSGLNELLFPEFKQSNLETACLLPLFASRVDPVRGPHERPVLCAAIPRTGQGAVTIQYEVLGDILWVRLMASATAGGGELARLPLDYYTCREAIVSAKGRGFTEAGATSVPRVERLRASLVSTARANPSLVLVGNMAVAALPMASN